MEEDLKSARPVDPSRLFDLGGDTFKVDRQQPSSKGKEGGNVDDADPEQVIQKTKTCKYLVQRGDRHKNRNRHGKNQNLLHSLLPPKLHFCKYIRGQGTQRKSHAYGVSGKLDGIDHRLIEDLRIAVSALKESGIVLKSHLTGQEGSRRLEHFIFGSQAQDQRPQDGDCRQKGDAYQHKNIDDVIPLFFQPSSLPSNC